MRITGGEHRGRPLHVPSGKEVRPTTDKVRQAIFNILVHEIQDAKVLDLFAGSGALGIEAISRGATSAIFIEKHRIPLQSLKRNLTQISSTERVIESDWQAGIRALRQGKQTFDLIFADPPYAEYSGDTIADAILGEGILGETADANSSLLAPQGILIIESGASDEKVTKMRLLKERVFDTTRISFYAV